MTVAAARAVTVSGSGGKNLLAAETVQTIADDDEAVMDAALDNRVFHNMSDFVLSNDIVFR
jgi:hypothetical protein